MAGGSGRGYESCSFTEPKRTRCLVHYGSRRQLFFRQSLRITIAKSPLKYGDGCRKLGDVLSL